jgi:hypothetical protein
MGSFQRKANSYPRCLGQNYPGVYSENVKVPAWTKELETLSRTQTYVRHQLHIPAALPPAEVAVPVHEAVGLWAKNGCA